MRWIPGTSGRNVEDRRGSRMGFGGGGGGFGKMGIGGVLLVLVLSFVFKKDFFSLLGSANGSGVTTTEGPISSSPAEDSLKDMVTFVLNDAQEVWTRALPVQARRDYREARLVLFRDAVESACGQAGASTGPFYCPGDEKIYIDLGFYQELENRFGASGDFAQAYVLAHEIGHHLQKILGVLGEGARDNAQSVAVELQADCFAGVWASTARERRLLDPGDVEEGLAAAAAVGDDRIQQMSGRAVNPESWTHGSAQQRSQWFRRGFDSGQMMQCTTANR